MKTEDHKSKLEDAKFGAKAFEPASGELPPVFPREMGPNAMKYLQEVVDSGLSSDIIQRFEQTLAADHGRSYCVSSPGCTLSLFALFLGLEFEPGDEIIVSPIADYGDVCGLLFENYIPVFCDTEPDTGLISAATIEPCITERTRAILAVNFFGLPCDFDPIMELAEKHDLIVIEDVCQSVLSTYKGRISSSLTHTATYSFDSEKTCGGDLGGALLTDDGELYERVVNRSLSRGAKQYPGFGRKHTYRGSALRIAQCSAATCLANWEILPRQVENRQRTAGRLDELIREIPGIIPYPVPDHKKHTYWMYGFSIESAAYNCSVAELAEQLKAAGIPSVGTGRYYVLPAAVPFLGEFVEREAYPFSIPPASRKVDYDADRVCPNAVAFMENWIRWPWTEKYTEQHIEQIADIVRDICRQNTS